MEREQIEKEEKKKKSFKIKTVLDLTNIGKKIKFMIYFGIFLLFIGLLVLFTSMMFLEYNVYYQEGIIPIYGGLLMVPTGLFFCTLGFTAIGLSSKDIDYRIRLGAMIASGLCILSAFFLLFTLNFLFMVR
ncbi:MAG: hypothetical protein KKH41_06150 [Candidatus Thermoplasmatota archaeon]|nr:hypothetical protein [Euryarchaeota archaeon]MBU4032339.1 hypothetical protein [Candidatus Thermoplasmatota archaeon]MBU4071742.1 hypothetical protein [Candidatus Thermoplasmatota archaeon]MBU4144836.1 hypothetical protein [Candidatus Thermoplasmatota archaeon]MBU4592149.1 hypothetical protein [Candidatus Thermoplasmatota archaeon]